MHMVFMRNVGSTAMDVIFDEDWERLKLELCRQMDVEETFNAHDGWTRLQNGDVIFDGVMFLCYMDTENPRGAKEYPYASALSLFKGEVVEFTDENEYR